jgi:hypothetical protein
LRFVLDGSTLYSTRFITDVSPGAHNIEVIDSHACRASFYAYMPTTLRASIISVTDRCYATNSGSVTLDVSGGVPPYLFSVDGVPRTFLSTVSGLSDGFHTFTISDNSPTVQSITLNATLGVLDPVLSGSFGYVNAPDVGSEGLIWINVTGAAGPYEYRLSPGFTFFQPSNVFTPLPGQWLLEARDSAGCVESKLFTVSAVMSFQVVPELVCPFGSVTTAVVNIAGGAAPFFVKVDNRAETTDLTISGLAAGDHTIRIRDSSTIPQVVQSSFFVSEKFPILLDLATFPNTDPASPDGRLVITASKSDSPDAVFSFTAGALTQPSNEFTNLADGPIPVSVSFDGCTTTATATIPTRRFYVASSTNPSCYGRSTGSITVAFTESTYVLPVNVTLLGYGLLDANLTASNLRAGLYQFVLTDSANPPVESRLVHRLDEPSALSGSAAVYGCRSISRCLYLRGVGGSPPYNHYAQILGYSRSEISSVDPIEAHPIYVSDVRWSVTDSSGCSVGGSLYGLPQLQVGTLGSIASVCPGSSTASFQVVATGGIGPFRWMIEPLDGQAAPGSILEGDTSVSVQNVAAGSYRVSVSDGAARNASTIAFVGTVDIQASVTPFHPNIGVQDGIISVQPTDYGLGPFVVFLAGRVSTSLAAPPYVFEYLPSGTYSVRLLSSRTGCSMIKQVQLVEKFSAAYDFPSITRPSCGLPNGKARINASGGTQPYFFVWDGETYANDYRTDISSGTHTVSVRDSSDPPREISLMPLDFSQVQQFSLIATTRDTDRTLNYGDIVVLIQNAITPVTVTIDGSPAFVGYNSGFLVGEHTVVAVDTYGCRVSQTVSTRARSVVAAVQTYSRPKCCGDLASVTLRSNPTWEYARMDLEIWSDSPVFTDLNPGRMYLFRVRDKTDPADYSETYQFIDTPDCFTINSVTPFRRRDDTSGAVRILVTIGARYSIQVDGGIAQFFDTRVEPTVEVPVPASLRSLPSTHNITAWTTDGCTDTKFVTLDPPLRVEYDQSSPACPEDSDGLVNLRITGGVAPFTIFDNQNREVTNSSFAGLAQGNHYFSVRDSGVPVQTVPVFVYIPIRPAWRVYDIDLAFNATTNGTSFTVPAPGGIEPLLYTLAHTSNASLTVTQRSNDFLVRRAGVYNLTVTDAVGCSKTAKVNVWENLSGTTSITSKRCIGSERFYTLNISPSGGSGSYYTGISGEPLTDGGSSRDLNHNAPIALVQDQKTLALVNIAVSDPFAGWEPLRATHTSSPSAVAGSDGSITVAASGGYPPYSYQMGTGSSQASNIFSGLSSRPYWITVTDSVGCAVSFGASVSEISPMSVSIDSSTTTDALCANTTTGGKIGLLASGGTAPYTYQYNGTTQTSAVFEGLAPESYNFTVTDSVGRTSRISATIWISPPITISWSLANVVVDSRDRLRPIIRVGGGPGSAYAFFLNGTRASTLPGPSYSVLTVATYGTYTLSVNSGGCSASVELPYYPPHQAFVAPTPQSCGLVQDGTISVRVLYGSGRFSYKLNATGAVWSTESVFTGLAAGIYEVSVLDNVTSIVTVSRTQVSSPVPLSLSVQGQRPFANANNGILRFSVSGGTRPYSLGVTMLSDGSVVTSDQLERRSIVPGDYIAVVTDYYGCTASLASPFTLYREVSLTDVFTTAPTCFEASDGSISVVAAGGNGDYMYAIIPAVGASANNATLNWQSSADFFGLVAGSYVVFARDSASPASTVRSVGTVSQPARVMLSYVSSGSLPGEATASVRFIASGGFGPYTLTYEPYLASVATNGDITTTGVPAGYEPASVIDSRGCSSSLNVRIYESIRASASSVSNVVCSGAATGQVVLSAEGGSGLYRYRIATRGGAIQWQSSPIFNNISAGTYDFLVEDAGDDAYSTLVSGVVVTQPAITFSALAARIFRSNFTQSTGAIVAASVGAQGSVEYQLDGGDFVSNSTFTNLASGNHSLTVRDALGCRATASVQVPALIEAVFAPTPVTCTDRTDGAATVSLRGGVPPFSFILLPEGRAQTSSQFTGLAAGRYQLRVSDSGAGDNVFLFDFVVPEANPIRIQVETLRRSQLVRVVVSGGAGAPYTWDTYSGTGYEYDSGSTEKTISGAFPMLRTIADASGCRAQFTIDAVSTVYQELLVNTTCEGAGPNKVYAKVRGYGGIPPYSHKIGDVRFGDDEWTLIAQDRRGTPVTTYDSWSIYPAADYTYLRDLWAMSPISATVLSTYSTSRVGNSDGGVTFHVEGSPDSPRGSAIFVRNSDQTTVTLATVYPGYSNLGSGLGSGDWTGTITQVGCSFSFNFTIMDPPAPIINDFACEIDPYSQVFRCSWSSQTYESVSMQYSMVTNNSSPVPDSSLFVSARSFSLFGPAVFPYTPGKTYYAKLIVSGLGGSTESVRLLEANIARPSRPEQIFNRVVPGVGVMVSWTLPYSPVPSEYVYDVYILMTNRARYLLAANVTTLSTLIASSTFAGLRDNRGQPFKYVVIPKAVNFGRIPAIFPEWLELSESYSLLVAPPREPQASIQILQEGSGYFEGPCSGRCVVVTISPTDFGGADSGTVSISLKSASAPDSEFELVWDKVTQFASDRVALPRRPFGFYATIRVSASNSIGVGYRDIDFVFAEPPLSPVLDLSYSSAGDLNYTRITMACRDVAPAMGFQASTYRYEYVVSATDPDWSQSTMTPEISGPFVATLVSNDSVVYARCVGINSAGEVANVNGVRSMYLPPPLKVPTNLKIELWGQEPNIDRITLRLTWDIAESRTNQQDGFTLSELSIFGADCSNSSTNVTLYWRSHFVYTRQRCAFGFSVRASNNRGATAFSEAAFTFANVRPSAPREIAPLFLPSSHTRAELNVSLLLVPNWLSWATDSVVSLTLQLASNGTKSNGTEDWQSLATFSRTEFETQVTEVNYVRGRRFTAALQITAKPTLFRFRFAVNNGLQSEWTYMEAVIVGQPVTPTVTASMGTFDPTNTTVSFEWPLSEFTEVTYGYTVTYNYLNGSSFSASRSTGNATRVSFFPVVAGTTVTLDLRTNSMWLSGSVSSASILVASGTYWPADPALLKPNITRASGTSVVVSWTADRTSHGFANTLYTVMLARGPNQPYNSAGVVNNPGSTSVITFTLTTQDFYVEDCSVTIVPRNPLGAGPPSAPSEYFDLIANRGSRQLMGVSVGRMIPVDDRITSVEFVWQSVPRADLYEIRYWSRYNFVGRIISNVPCCSVFVNASKLDYLDYIPYFRDYIHGWMSDRVDRVSTPQIIGLPDVVVFDSLLVASVNSSGGQMQVTWSMPQLSGRSGEIFSAIRYSPFGAESWTTITVAASCSTGQRFAWGPEATFCTSNFFVSAAPGSEFEVQVAGVTQLGRGPWSVKTRAAGLAARPVAVSGWLDETDAAVANPLAWSDGTNFKLPLRWSNQRPYGSDISEYRIRVWSICYWRDCPAYLYRRPEFSVSDQLTLPSRIYCGLPDSDFTSCEPVPIVDATFTPTSAARSNPAATHEYWLPVTVAADQRVVIYARNSWGWSVIFDRYFTPAPIMPTWNATAVRAVRQEFSVRREITVAIQWTSVLPIDHLFATEYRNRFSQPFFLQRSNMYPTSGGFGSAGMVSCSRDSDTPLFVRCSTSTIQASGWELPDGTNNWIQAGLRFAREYSPYRNSTLPSSRRVPIDWYPVSNNGSSALFTKGAIMPPRCYGTGAWGPSPIAPVRSWKYIYVAYDITYFQFFKQIEIVQSWRDGHKAPTRRILNWLPWGNFRRELSQGFGYEEYGWDDTAGVVDVDVTFLEQTQYTDGAGNPVNFEYKSSLVCDAPAQPEPPTLVVLGEPSTLDGMCVVPINASSNGGTGALNFVDIVIRAKRWFFSQRDPSSSASITRFEYVPDFRVPVSQATFDNRTRTWSFSVKLPLNNYISVETALSNDRGYGSAFTAATFGPIFCATPRQISLAPTSSFVSTQGNNGLRIVYDPPLPEYIVASPVARVRIDGVVTTLTYNNVSYVDLPPLPAGPHTIAVSLDAIFWGPNFGVSSVEVPLSPSTVSPAYFDVRRPGDQVSFFHPNFRSIRTAFCDVGPARVEAAFSSDRQTVSCTLPTFNYITPSVLPVRLSLDGTNTSALAQPFYWGTISRPLSRFPFLAAELFHPLDSNLVKIVRTFTPTDDPANLLATNPCSSFGSSYIYLSLSRWPYVPESRPVYAYFSSSSGGSDPFNLTFTWDPTRSMFRSAFPYVAPDTYDFLLGDGDGLRFGRGSLRHSAECSPTRQAAVMNRVCDACASPNTWVYPAGGYGLCVPSGDVPLFSGYSVGCPPGYLGSLKRLDPVFHRSTATYIRPGGSLATISATLTVVNPTGFLSGSGTWSFVSRWYPFAAEFNGTFTAPISSSSQVRFNTSIILDPWTANLGQEVELRIQFPGQLPRSLVIVVPFRPGLSLVQSEAQTLGKMLMVIPFGDFAGMSPFYSAEFANPELVTSVRTFVTTNEVRADGVRVSRVVPLLRSTGCRTNCTAPSFGPRLKVHAFPPFSWGQATFQIPDLSIYTFGFPYGRGVHTFTAVVNEGLPSEERVSTTFAVLDVTDARSMFAAITTGGSYSASCNNPIDTFQICFESGFNHRESQLFPGAFYPYGSWVKMGMIVNSPIPAALPDGLDSEMPVKFVFRYSNQIWYRGEMTYTGYAEGRIALPVAPPVPVPGAQLFVGITVSIVADQEIVGVSSGGDPEIRNIRIVAAGMVTAALQLPVYRASMGFGFLSASADVFFSFGIGPSQEFCNQDARLQPRCNVDPVLNRPGWTVAPGFLTEIRTRVSASAGVPLLFSVSLWTETNFIAGSTRYRENGQIVHVSGYRSNIKVCGSVTAFFITTRRCPIDFTQSDGEIPANSLVWKKRNLPEERASWTIVSRETWPQEFQQISSPVSWSGKLKRAVPISDHGSLVLDTIPTASPCSVAGLNRSRGLALVAWSGFDTRRSVLTGGVVVLSLYNSTSDKMTDPVWLRDSSDSDSASSIAALPDGRFLVLLTSIPQQSITDPELVLAKTELLSAIVEPATMTWTSPVPITSDATYFDGMASSVAYLDPTSGTVRVMTTWVRSIDSVLATSNQKQLMWSVFNPSTNAWATPQVLVSSLNARSAPSLAVANNTILMGYVDADLSANRTAAYLHRYNTATQQWAVQPVAVGRAYNFVNESNWNASAWDSMNPLHLEQHSIVVSAKDGATFVVVWTDVNAVFSRVYKLSDVQSIFGSQSASHPLTQPVWTRSGALPRDLTVLAVPDATHVGEIVSWSYVSVEGSKWGFDYMRHDSDLWESAAVGAESSVNENVLHTTLFSASPDTAFILYAAQELLTFSNQTQSVGKVSIEYKRLNLLPLVQFEDALIAPVVAPLATPYDLRLSIRNKGLLPSLASEFKIVQGDLYGPSSLATSIAEPYTLASLGSGKSFNFVVSSVRLISLSNAGYLWASVTNSSIIPLRIPTFTVRLSEIKLSQSASAESNIDISATLLCAAILPSGSPSRDEFAQIPIHFYTRDVNNGLDVKLATYTVNCSLDGTTKIPVAHSVDPSVLLHSVTVAAGAQDDYVPMQFSILPNVTTSVLAFPDLNVFATTAVRVSNAFIGSARFVIEVSNLGLVDSKNVTVNITTSSSSGTVLVSSTFLPIVQKLSKATVELPIGARAVGVPGVYNFTIEAKSLVSEVENARFMAEVAANSSTRATGPDYEQDMADNMRQEYDVRLFSAWKPRFDETDVSVKDQPSLSMSMWLGNAALDVPAADIPVRFYVIADNVPLTLVGEKIVPFLNASSSTIVQLDPAANGSSLLVLRDSLQNARLVVSIPAMFSGSTDSAEVVVPLSTAVNNPVPSAAKQIVGEPGLILPQVVYLSPNETLSLQLSARNLNYDGVQVMVRQIQGLEQGARLDNASMILFFDSNNLNTLPATITTAFALFLPSGVVLESYAMQIVVGILPTSEVSAPVQPPALPVLPGQPPSGGAEQSSSSAAGIAIGIIFALIAVALIVFAALFARRKNRGTGKDAVKLFFMPWKADVPPATSAEPMTTNPASTSKQKNVPAAKVEESDTQTSSSSLPSQSSDDDTGSDPESDTNSSDDESGEDVSDEGDTNSSHAESSEQSQTRSESQEASESDQQSSEPEEEEESNHSEKSKQSEEPGSETQSASSESSDAASSAVSSQSQPSSEEEESDS